MAVSKGSSLSTSLACFSRLVGTGDLTLVAPLRHLSRGKETAILRIFGGHGSEVVAIALVCDLDLLKDGPFLIDHSAGKLVFCLICIMPQSGGSSSQMPDIVRVTKGDNRVP